MKILAISGWKKSGKDTLCDYLAKNGAQRISFADPLKDRVAEEYNIPRAWLDDQNMKEAPLMNLPVDPQDAFTRTIAQLLVREFRTEDREVAIDFDEKLNMGVISNQNFKLAKLYWTPRALAIFKGSGNRAVASDYWVQQVIQKIQFSSAGVIIVPDLRFRSEVEQLSNKFHDKLYTVRVNRFDDTISTDASERDLDKHVFDHVIENRGTLEDFHAAIENLKYLYNV